MGVIIETEHLKAEISEHGAELVSLKHKEHGIEYIWQADPKHWARHAPVLFPIVGALKNGTYRYQGKNYHMSQHGFARDSLFTVVETTQSSVTFLLESSVATKEIYPFDFQLYVSYELSDVGVTVGYKVVAPNDNDLYFSIGGHPAFNVPLDGELGFSDYYLEPTPMKSRIIVPLKEGQIDLDHRTLGQTNAPLALSHEMFANDALIFETKGTNSFSIKSEKSRHSVTLSYNNFPYVGIWSTYPVESSFVCIEPWYGIADTLEASGELTEKLGVQKLPAGESFNASYQINVE